ncbi:hypothetical protein [Natrinema sp. HArc-T2]|uniref:hypothetical protein n=1 Tax=Natrinema sp. HArc-T2 TaxID=3242701 RepID=UPI00359D352A
MNRKKVLMTLGMVVMMGGVVIASGAFTQVTADRDAEFVVNGDSNGYLNLTGDGEYVVKDDQGAAGEDIITFGFNSLNDNATTTVNGALTIENNANDGNKEVYIKNEDPVNRSVIDFQYSSESDGISGTDGNSIVGSGNSVTVGNQSATLVVDIKIDTNQGDPSSIENVTIVAAESTS